MTVSVRGARPGDGSGIARVWLSAAAYYAGLDPVHFQVPSTEGLADLFENAIPRGGGDVLQLVAELDGRVVGWLSARVQRPGQDAEVELAREHGWTRLMVEVLIVDRGQWRRGAGTALLERAESWGRHKGAEVVRLGTYAHSPVAVGFYEQHMGYTRRSIIFQKRLRSSDPQRPQNRHHPAANGSGDRDQDI
jgi:GNAT superfamily N-acetyltransferase